MHIQRRTGQFFLRWGGRGWGKCGWSRPKIGQKILVHKNMIAIRSMISILLLVFTYFIICLRNKKKLSLWLWKQSHLCVKRLVLIGIQLIKEYKCNVNCLIKTISDKTLYRIQLTKILEKIFFDHHPITSK